MRFARIFIRFAAALPFYAALFLVTYVPVFSLGLPRLFLDQL